MGSGPDGVRGPQLWGPHGAEHGAQHAPLWAAWGPCEARQLDTWGALLALGAKEPLRLSLYCAYIFEDLYCIVVGGGDISVHFKGIKHETHITIS